MESRTAELFKSIPEARKSWGFSNNVQELLIGVASETGEMISAVSKEYVWKRKQSHVPDDDKSSIKHEMADVLIYLAALADALGINLEDAVKSKMKINDGRFGNGSK
jgi:NTP pyrophosphatase (non-canonical NTP hydrolase)